MIAEATRAEIRRLGRLGLSQRNIANRVKCSRRTVVTVLGRGEPPARKKPQSKRQLDPTPEQIKERAEEIRRSRLG